MIMKKATIFSAIAFVFLALMFACSSGSSTSGTGSGNSGTTGIQTGIIRAYRLDSGFFVSPGNVYETNGFFVFATGEWDHAHWPGGKDSYSGIARLIRVLDISSFPVSFTDYPDVIVSEMVKLADGYLIVGRSTKGETDKAYAAVLSQTGELLSDFEYEYEFQGYAKFHMVAVTSDGYLLNNLSKFIYLGTDLAVKWERNLTTEWDPNLEEGATLHTTYKCDMASDADGSFVVLMGLDKHTASRSDYGYSILRINAQGEIVSVLAKYPEDTNARWRPHRLLLKSDGTMLIGYMARTASAEGEIFTPHVALLDASGDTVWDYDQGSDIFTKGADGSVYMAWSTDATGSAHPNNLLTQLHVAKLTSQGELVWSKVHANLIDYFEPSAISLSDDGGIVIVGRYADHKVTDDGSDDEQGILLIKLDAQGNCPDCN